MSSLIASQAKPRLPAARKGRVRPRKPALRPPSAPAPQLQPSASELAREVHCSQPSLFQVCRELEESGAVQGFRQGNQHRYRLQADRWRGFLGLEGLRWTPWAAVFHFHQGLWRFFFRREWEGVSAYLQASEFREALRESLRAAGAGSLAADFQKVLAIPGEAFLPAARQQLLDSLAWAGRR